MQIPITKKGKQRLSHESSGFSDFIFKQRSRGRGNPLDTSIKVFDSELKAEKLEQFSPSNEQFHREMFAVLYEDAPELENPNAMWAKGVHDMLNDTGEFRTLSDMVDGDPDLASLTTGYIMNHFKTEIVETLHAIVEQSKENEKENKEREKQRKEQEKKRQEQQKQQQNPNPQQDQGDKKDENKQENQNPNQDGQGDGGNQQNEQGKSPNQDGQGDPSGLGGNGQQGGQNPNGQSQQGNQPLPVGNQVGIGDISNTIREQIKGKVVQKAEKMQDKIDEIQEVLDGLNMLGLGIGSGTGTPERSEFVRSFFNDRSIRNLLKLLGRLKKEMRGVPALVKSKRKVKTYEIEQDRAPNELTRERALMMLDDNAYAFRFATKKQWKRKKENGKERAGAGDIVMAMDVSGSMGRGAGSCLEIAKTIALSLLAIAREQKRSFKLVTFNGYLVGSYETNNKMNEKEFIHMFGQIKSIGSGGGTRFQPPMDWCMRKVGKTSKSDIIFLTDGAGYLDNISHINKEKQKKRMRIFSLYIHTSSSPDLDKVSDGTLNVANLQDERSLGGIAKLLKTVKNRVREV